MLHRLKAWLSPTQHLLDEVRGLRRDVAALKAAELERETVMNDQLDKLARMIKRVRQRAVRAGESDQLEIDPISAQILRHRGLRMPSDNGEE